MARTIITTGNAGNSVHRSLSPRVNKKEHFIRPASKRGPFEAKTQTPHRPESRLLYSALSEDLQPYRAVVIAPVNALRGEFGP